MKETKFEDVLQIIHKKKFEILNSLKGISVQKNENFLSNQQILKGIECMKLTCLQQKQEENFLIYFFPKNFAVLFYFLVERKKNPFII